MSNAVLELVGLAIGLAALGCFVAAAWTVSTVVGVLVLGGALLLVSLVLVVAANTRKPKVPRS